MRKTRNLSRAVRPVPPEAEPILQKAKVYYEQLKLYAPHGPGAEKRQGARYKKASEQFIDCLVQLSNLGLSQVVTAARLGVSRPVVSQWLAKRPAENVR